MENVSGQRRSVKGAFAELGEQRLSGNCRCQKRCLVKRGAMLEPPTYPLTEIVETRRKRNMGTSKRPRARARGITVEKSSTVLGFRVLVETIPSLTWIR